MLVISDDVGRPQVWGEGEATECGERWQWSHFTVAIASAAVAGHVDVDKCPDSHSRGVPSQNPLSSPVVASHQLTMAEAVCKAKAASRGVKVFSN